MKKALLLCLIILMWLMSACDRETPTPTMPVSETTPVETVVVETDTPALTAEATATLAATLPMATPDGGQSAATATAAPPTSTMAPIAGDATVTPTSPPLANIPAFEGMTLLYHVAGGIAGLCQDLAAFDDGQVLYGECGSLRQGELSQEQMAQLAAWQAAYAAFEYRFEENPGGPDSMTTTLVFAGLGHEAASVEVQEEIVAWVREAYATLVAKAQGSAGLTVQIEPLVELDGFGDEPLVSPLVVSGEAMAVGQSLVVRVEDQQGEVIGQTLAKVAESQAQAGPFETEVLFTQPEVAQTGRVVVLRKLEDGMQALASAEVQLAAADGAGEPLVTSAKLRTFTGQGFALPYLADGVVEQVAPGQWRLVGRSVAVRPADADWIWNGPSYHIEIMMHENEGLTSEAWARAFLAGDWTQAQIRGTGEPFTGPVDGDGQIDEAQVAAVRLGDKAAFRADWFAGDSERRVIYLSLRDQTVSFAFSLDPLANNPLTLAQQDVYGLTLAQVQTDKAQGMPDTVPLAMDVQPFMAPGFEVLVAGHATMAEVEEDHWQLSGPTIQVEPASGDEVWSGPAYQLDFVLMPNEDELGTVEWAQACLIQEWQQAQEDEAPYTGPVDGEGELVRDRVETLELNGVPAFQADYVAGDRLHRVVYVQAASKILAIHYNVLAAESHPVASLANAAHALVVNSVRAGF